MLRSRDNPVRVESMHSLHFIILSLFLVLCYIPETRAGKSKGYDLPMVRDWQGLPKRVSRSKRIKVAKKIMAGKSRLKGGRVGGVCWATRGEKSLKDEGQVQLMSHRL